MSITKKIYTHFSQFIQHNVLNLDKPKIAIGYSGGVDSAVMLHLFYLWNKNNPNQQLNIEPILFQHNNSSINTENNEHIKFCESNCALYDLKLTVIPIDLSESQYRKQSDESAGFLARKKFYKESDFDCVFLAHHLDDQTETVLSQLFRGAGKAMSGMAEIDGNHYRPLLKFEKNDLRQYLSENNIPYHEEPLNYDNSYTRNFWRNEVIPKIKEHYPQTNQRIALFAKKQKKTNNLLKDLAYVDGLQEFINSDSFVGTLSADRMENLLKHYVKIKHNKSLSINIWEEIEKRMYGKQEKPFCININELNISFKKNKGKWNITTTIPNLKNNIKL